MIDHLSPNIHHRTKSNIKAKFETKANIIEIPIGA